MSPCGVMCGRCVPLLSLLLAAVVPAEVHASGGVVKQKADGLSYLSVHHLGHFERAARTSRRERPAPPAKSSAIQQVTQSGAILAEDGRLDAEALPWTIVMPPEKFFGMAKVGRDLATASIKEYLKSQVVRDQVIADITKHITALCPLPEGAEYDRKIAKHTGTTAKKGKWYTREKDMAKWYTKEKAKAEAKRENEIIEMITWHIKSLSPLAYEEPAKSELAEHQKKQDKAIAKITEYIGSLCSPGGLQPADEKAQGDAVIKSFKNFNSQAAEPAYDICETLEREGEQKATDGYKLPALPSANCLTAVWNIKSLCLADKKDMVSEYINSLCYPHGHEDTVKADTDEALAVIRHDVCGTLKSQGIEKATDRYQLPALKLGNCFRAVVHIKSLCREKTTECAEAEAKAIAKMPGCINSLCDPHSPKDAANLSAEYEVQALIETFKSKAVVGVEKHVTTLAEQAYAACGSLAEEPPLAGGNKLPKPPSAGDPLSAGCVIAVRPVKVGQNTSVTVQLRFTYADTKKKKKADAKACYMVDLEKSSLDEPTQSHRAGFTTSSNTLDVTKAFANTMSSKAPNGEPRLLECYTSMTWHFFSPDRDVVYGSIFD